MPVLNVYAEADHIIPPPTVRALGGRLGTDDYTELGLPGGHIGMFVSAQIANPGGQGHRRLAHCARWLTTSDSTHPRPKETPVSTQTQRTEQIADASARPTSGSSSTAARGRRRVSGLRADAPDIRRLPGQARRRRHQRVADADHEGASQLHARHRRRARRGPAAPRWRRQRHGGPVAAVAVLEHIDPAPTSSSARSTVSPSASSMRSRPTTSSWRSAPAPDALEHPRPSINGEFGDRLRHVSYFLSHVTRPAYWAGQCDLVPNHFSEIPHLADGDEVLAGGGGGESARSAWLLQPRHHRGLHGADRSGAVLRRGQPPDAADAGAQPGPHFPGPRLPARRR